MKIITTKTRRTKQQRQADNKKKHNLSMRYKKELMTRYTFAEKLLIKEFDKLKPELRLLQTKPHKQKVIWNAHSFYIMDFYFASHRLCVEIDGSSHVGKEYYDSKRDGYILRKKGIVTLRLSNEAVIAHPRESALSILALIAKLPRLQPVKKERAEKTGAMRRLILNSIQVVGA